MIAIEIVLLFAAILSSVLLAIRLWMIRLVVKNKGTVKDDGTATSVLCVVLAASVAMLIAFWDKF